MTRYIVNRLLVSIPIFFGITMMVYAMYAFAPGDPVAMIVGSDNARRMSPQQLERIRHQYGFDQPVYARYLLWLGRAVRGDLGYPYRGNTSVVESLGKRIPPTLLLMAVSLLLALIIGVPMGIVMALRQYSWPDLALTVVAFVNLSVPNFFLALGFIYVFALKLGVLPTYGMATVGAPFSLGDRLAHLVMPATIMGIFNAGVWARYARSSILEVMRADYVVTARAKGLKEATVVGRHILRNALLPLVTIVGLSLPSLFGGSIIIETIFQWPGMGMLGWRATITRDYPMVMGITLVSAIMILLSNLVADIAYALVDPRIRYD